jgi:hypothetical protein
VTSVERALAPKKMTIRDIAMRWAKELDCNAPALELAMYRAILDSEFDDLPKGKGALSCDPTGKNGSTTGVIIRRELEQLDDASGFHRFALAAEVFGLHQEAVLIFAERRGLILPSWWTPENRPPLRKRNISAQALLTFLQQHADGLLTEGQLQARAEETFAGKNVPRRVWRDAFGKLNKAKKRPVGVSRKKRSEDMPR